MILQSAFCETCHELIRERSGPPDPYWVHVYPARATRAAGLHLPTAPEDAPR